ncbi:hypothetical protein LTR08_002938 [Meristemomyces frigidus]|nr:hypothetical protein LTR08_002938 [Meristemomyces frigidus]
MSAPRGRWPRPPRNFVPRNGHTPPANSPTSNSVPTIQQVTPGAPVSIVLKEDQPTGRQVQGVVQDLLTRGNHPRGIKVRLLDGRVGRVQRLGSGGSSGVVSAAAAGATGAAAGSKVPAASPRVYKVVRDIRLDEEEFPSMPPARGLADFMPGFGGEEVARGGGAAVSATCPVCGVFEGDEVAVSRHVEGCLS